MQHRCFLVVDDEPLTRGSLSRLLRPFGAVVTAASRAEACGALATRAAWSGFVIDLRLPDGSGLDVLAHARVRHSLTPAILLSGALEPEAVNGAFALAARCLCKPCPAECLRAFARDAVLAEREVPQRVQVAVGELAARHSLTPAQAEIVLRTLQGVEQSEIVAARRVSKNTHKTQVRDILRKTRTLSLGELRDRVLRTVAGAA